VSDISVLKKLTKLELLYLSDTSVSDTSALRELKSLKLLDLSSSKVSSADCESLENYLPNTQIDCYGLK